MSTGVFIRVPLESAEAPSVAFCNFHERRQKVRGKTAIGNAVIDRERQLGDRSSGEIAVENNDHAPAATPSVAPLAATRAAVGELKSPENVALRAGRESRARAIACKRKSFSEGRGEPSGSSVKSFERTAWIAVQSTARS